LVDANELLLKLEQFTKTKATHYTLTLTIESPGLLSIYLGLTSETSYKAKQVLQLYAGATDDFQPPTFEEAESILLGECLGLDFNARIKVAKDIVNPSESQPNRLIEWTWHKDSFTLFCRAKNDLCWAQQTCPGKFEIEDTYSLDSRSLNKLLTLALDSTEVNETLSVKFYLETQVDSGSTWLKFETPYSSVSYVIANQGTKTKQSLIFEELNQTTLVTLELNGVGLLHAFSCLHNKANVLTEYFLVNEEEFNEELVLKIRETESILTDVVSQERIIYRNDKDFIPFCLQFRNIEILLGALINYRSQTISKENSKDYNITLRLGLKAFGDISVPFLFAELTSLPDLTVHTQGRDPTEILA
jgi:hypothetical protein